MSSANEGSRRASLEIERAQAQHRINRGIIYFVIGLGITIVTFAMAKPGGTFIISYGPMLVGAFRFIQGSLGMARVNSELSRLAPQTGYTQSYDAVPQQTSQQLQQQQQQQPSPHQPQAHPQYVQQPTSSATAGWHADPSQKFQFRYWDGSTWTAHVQTNGVAAHDPVG